MKKQLIFVLLFLSIKFYFFSDIINWKGMEFGHEKVPKWLKSYTTKNDEKIIRKKFDIDSTQSVLVGIGNAATLENARHLSYIDVQSKISKNISIKKTRLMFIYEYWLEDSEKGFIVYSVYVY